MRQRLMQPRAAAATLGFILFAHPGQADPSCDASGGGTTSETYTHGRATLSLALDDPPPDDLKVPIRGRPRLTYSHRDELPEFIRSPHSASFPLVAHARDSSGGTTDTEEDRNATLTIASYANAASQLLGERLVSHGAVQFRGLPLADSADFNAFVGALGDGWNPIKLAGGGTQRSDVQANVRSASDEPPEQTIEPHMDMAHSTAHPKRIAFFCAEGPPPGAGGETALTDMRGVYAELERQGIPQTFEARGGIAYHKRLWSAEYVNHTYTWEKFFFTSNVDDALAEIRKRDPGARVHEHGPGVIDFIEVLPAVHLHPKTGEPTWFNGVHMNHRSYYEEADHVDTSDGSPMDTSYADGTPIPEDTIAAVRRAIWRNSVAVRLETGDLVIVDNMLAAHGRMSWVQPAPRRVLLTHFG